MNYCFIMFIAHSSAGLFLFGASSIVIREKLPETPEKTKFFDAMRKTNLEKHYFEKSYQTPWLAITCGAMKNSHQVTSSATTTVATATTILTSHQLNTNTINTASKASPNSSTYHRKPAINLEHFQILHFYDSLKPERDVLDFAELLTIKRTTLTTKTPQSSLTDPSFTRQSSSSSLPLQTTFPSSSSFSKLLKNDELTRDRLPFFTTPDNSGQSRRVSESHLSKIFLKSYNAFYSHPKHFSTPTKNGKYDFINFNVRYFCWRLLAFTDVVEKKHGKNDSNYNFVKSKTLKKCKRDYLVRGKKRKFFSNDKFAKERRHGAWTEGTQKVNNLRRARPIRSFDSNLKKSMQKNVLDYNHNDDHNATDHKGINGEVTTNLQYIDSSQTSFNSILESSDLNVSSISQNISDNYFDLKIMNNKGTIQIFEETEDDDDDDQQITFWSLPKDWKNFASKRKPQIFRNLTILPLGMLLIFLVLVILQVSRWCLEDIRESDGPHLNYTYHLSILGGRDNSMYNKSITSRNLCDANIYEVPSKPKQNMYGRNGARKQKHLPRYLLRGNSAPNGASDGLAYGCRGVVELMMKSSAGMLSNRSLASCDYPFINSEEYSCSAPRLSETPRGSQQTLELNYLHGRKFRAGVVHSGDKKLSGNRKHNKRVSRSLNNFKSEPRLASNPQQMQHRSRLSTLKKGSSTESASNSSLASLTQQQQQKKKQQKRWQRQNRQKRQHSNISDISENSYYGQTLGSLLVMPSRLVVAPMAVASPSATVSTLLSSNSSSTAIHPPISVIAKENADSRTRHHSSPASSNSIKILNFVPSDNKLNKTSTAAVMRFHKQPCLEFDLKEGDSTYKLLESDCDSLDVEIHEQINVIKESQSKLAISQHPNERIESINDESTSDNNFIRAVDGNNLKMEDYDADLAENNC